MVFSTICIAGKNQIACDCLKFLIEIQNSDYKICVLPNSTDDGQNHWAPSLKKYAKSQNINIIENIKELYLLKDLIFISLQYNQIINTYKFLTKNYIPAQKM